MTESLSGHFMWLNASPLYSTPSVNSHHSTPVSSEPIARQMALSAVCSVMLS